MRTTSSTKLRRALGLLMAGAFIGGAAYADDQQARDASASSAMSCEQYTGAERTECERRQEDRSAMSTRDSDESDANRNASDASAAAGTRSTDRTRVSRAENVPENKANNEDDESKYWDSEREREPGVVKGADMQTVPIPEPEDRRDDPNSDLTDPYQVAPGTDGGPDEEHE